MVHVALGSGSWTAYSLCERRSFYEIRRSGDQRGAAHALSSGTPGVTAMDQHLGDRRGKKSTVVFVEELRGQ